MPPEVARMTLPTRIKRALAALAVVGAGAAVAVGSVAAADQTVNIAGLEFEPAEITVAVGDTITWEVTEAIGSPHSVTSGTPGDADAGEEFDSGPAGLADVGETFEHTFESAGTFDYYCTVHGASMSGQVVVAEAGASEPPAESEPPAKSEPPTASEAPGESEAPEASEPPHELREPISSERKLLAAGVLGATLVILFGAAAVWRRMNPA
jgi:plastocyanin